MTSREEYGPQELYAGLTAGCLWNLAEIMETEPDVLVALDRLPASVWETGFRGEILYYPTPGRGVLPAEIRDRLVQEIVERAEEKKKTAIISAEDRGKIGYIAACVLFRLGIREPEEYLRDRHSAFLPEKWDQTNAVISYKQKYTAQTYRNTDHKACILWVDNPEQTMNDPEVQAAADRIQRELGEEARLVLRPSGMLPTIRVTVEAVGADSCEAAMQDFIDAVERTGHLEGVED